MKSGQLITLTQFGNLCTGRAFKLNHEYYQKFNDTEAMPLILDPKGLIFSYGQQITISPDVEVEEFEIGRSDFFASEAKYYREMYLARLREINRLSDILAASAESLAMKKSTSKSELDRQKEIMRQVESILLRPDFLCVNDRRYATNEYALERVREVLTALEKRQK